ncbi:MAG: hypothetical protein ACHQFX_20510 [Chitinophagales bacterium]
MKGKTNPIQRKEDIRENPDRKISEDFKDYPDGPGKDETIKPRTKQQKKVADADNKDGEKRNYKKNETNEQDSDGSANAFEDK